jgi:hypothetical protein
VQAAAVIEKARRKLGRPVDTSGTPEPEEGEPGENKYQAETRKDRAVADIREFEAAHAGNWCRAIMSMPP